MNERQASPARKRYAPSERRRMILDGAISFFAEYGLDGSTHLLAKHLGVTQPLIYQYFPSKEDLIDAVYEEVFRGRWSSRWDTLLADRARPLEERLNAFFVQYCAVSHAPEWMRIYLFSGLRNLELNKRYNPIIEERVIARLCREVRASLGAPDFDEVPLTPQEQEATWILHGGIFYYGVRRYIYRVATSEDTEVMVRSAVTVYLEGMPALYRRLGLLA